MLKYHKIISFCIGLGFIIVLQRFSTPEPVFRFLLPAFIVFVVAVTAYNSRYLKEIQKYNVWTLARPVLLLCAGFGIFLFAHGEILRGLFLISSVAIITLFEMTLGNQAENVLLNETLFIAFGLFFAFFGASYYFPGYSPLYLAGVFLGAALLSRSFFEFLPQPEKTKAVGSVVLGLFSAELFWALNFLPFHFSVLALTLFALFYFCLIVNYYFLFHILNYKKVQFHFLLIVFCIILAGASTPWRILE